MTGLVISIWMAVAVPVAHGRSRWWTAALLVPALNIAGYWVYAFTLPASTRRTVAGAVA